MQSLQRNLNSSPLADTSVDEAMSALHATDLATEHVRLLVKFKERFLLRVICEG
jgi:hypothetical protein